MSDTFSPAGMGAAAILLLAICGCAGGAREPGPRVPALAPRAVVAPDPAAAGPELPAEEPVGPVRTPEPAKFVEEPLPADAAVLLRHKLSAARRLTYGGTVVEEAVARLRQEEAAVSRKAWHLVRQHQVLPSADGVLAAVYSGSEEQLTAARQAGRDALEELRARPSRGLRFGAAARRLGPRGAEPGAADQSPLQRFEPVPEIPTFPAARLTAAAPLADDSGPYRITWKLLGAGSFGGRKCWRVIRSIEVLKGVKIAPDDYLAAEDEYLVAAGDGTVLRLERHWQLPSGALLARMTVVLELLQDRELPAAELAKAAAGVEQTAKLLALIRARQVGEAARLAAKMAAAGLRGGPLDLAARFTAGEQALAEPRGGERRIELVPEDSYVHLWAPEKLKPADRLRPVVFFHGAVAGPDSYFRDWKSKVGDRPVLLVFPQSRSWTWQMDADGAMVGSLLERLGRTYNLDRGALVLAGHGAGAELAWALGYGADFPGWQVRGMVAAGAPVPERIRVAVSDGKHEALAARARATDALLLAGERDKLAPLAAMQNAAQWLSTFNPGGVELRMAPGIGQQYPAELTGYVLEWIMKLRPAGAKPDDGPPRN